MTERCRSALWTARAWASALPRPVGHSLTTSVDSLHYAVWDTPPWSGTLWDMVMRVSPECNRAVYRVPGFMTAYRRALDEAFAQGPAGYARDTVLAMGRWPFDLAKITIPADLWYGERELRAGELSPSDQMNQ